ncbi:DUF488 family protein (plasmid) [Aneurinibacillus sp. Ricciae_BoGa-3]|uniref:DUF488 family protein, N3 subclade n=1 Tax=Aneurinibacillus sp. Ricciae_BoGa-3 TaxID=3022697 RepID=UPI0023426520|nr:DUF488 family protein [Aneurinibacillus sp. Ricciae_BoGa-3]WCK57152.1 DUF488 family protein [Aneurinibacillus sp. Ricciae_BoGa-3]
MLHLAYLGESKKLEIPDRAAKFLIVRKPVSGIPAGFLHIPQLSPSLNLFDKTQIWKKKIYQSEDVNYLHSLDIGELEDGVWWHLYKKEFISELVERPDMVRAIERLADKLDKGVEVYLFCYCKNVCRCHRGLVGEHMESKGYLVDFRKQEEPKPQETLPAQLSLFD